MNKQNTLIRLQEGDTYIIAEERNGILTRRLQTLDTDEGTDALALRLCLAYNASAGLTISRLASLAAPSVAVPLHEALAVLDAIVKNDPALIHRILSKLREVK